MKFSVPAWEALWRDPIESLLLRARRERPRCRRAAEQRDELAASDESCHLIPPAGRLRPNDSTVERCSAAAAFPSPSA
jgi:hypothetical protein